MAVPVILRLSPEARNKATSATSSGGIAYSDAFSSISWAISVSIAPGQIATYRVDARLLASPIRTPELEHDLHVTVQNNVQDLHQGRFEILRIEPIRGDNGTIAYYDVSVKP